jgi:hypothetical protein
MYFFSGVSFLRSGEKVDCKKWYEGEKSFIKIESMYIFDVVKLRMYVTNVVFGTGHVYWKYLFPF